jgi:DNA-binding HxlR family transcriptional regulator
LTRSYKQICPVARTLDLIGERWTMLVLRDLFLRRSKFAEFIADSPTIPTRILSDRLKMLEERGFVAREIYSEHPLRASYHLTESGQTLAPVIEAIFRWGAEHTLNARERDAVFAHLYGDAKAEPRFPPQVQIGPAKRGGAA